MATLLGPLLFLNNGGRRETTERRTFLLLPLCRFSFVFVCLLLFVLLAFCLSPKISSSVSSARMIHSSLCHFSFETSASGDLSQLYIYFTHAHLQNPQIIAILLFWTKRAAYILDSHFSSMIAHPE